MDHLGDEVILDILNDEESSPRDVLSEVLFSEDQDTAVIVIQSVKENNNTSIDDQIEVQLGLNNENPDMGLEVEGKYVVLTEVDNVAVDILETINNDENVIHQDEENTGLRDNEEKDYELNNEQDEYLRLDDIDECEDRDLNVTNSDEEENNLNTRDNEENDALPKQKGVRKRVPKPENWKRNIRKKKYHAGEEYVNEKGKTIPKKILTPKKDCFNTCKLNCSKNITDDERNSLFCGFYDLKNHTEKQLFLIGCTERFITNRKTSKNDEKPSRRQFTFKYYFSVKGSRIQVCKSFFLSTLQISQKPVYNAHLNKHADTGLPKPDSRGKLKVGQGIPEQAKTDVRNHICSFPVVQSHYCRADTTKHYLESTLSISKMYSLFKEKYPEHIIKESMYRRIFVTEFNLDFHVPKKDRCDLCEEHKMAAREKIGFDEEKYQSHIVAKTAMRAERAKDRGNGEVPVLSFDLQNVITCPRAEISSFFYFSKLNVYNLTGHLKSKSGKQVYCVIWPETMGGRTGNDIASAVYKLLSKILKDNPSFEHITTWSDSCVPQNRNQMMSGAMLLLLKENPNLKSITMKFSTPGHGAVQDVDNVHSHIEKALSISEFYSPLGLVRILKNMNQKHPYNIIQMTKRDFLDFAESSKDLNFSLIPFSKVSSIQFNQVFDLIKFNEVHESDMKCINIKPNIHDRKPTRKRLKQRNDESPTAVGYKFPKPITKCHNLSAAKKKDLKQMERFMPLLDRQFFTAILNEN